MSQIKLDFGVNQKSEGQEEEYPDKDYDVTFLSEMKEGDEFEGEIHISNIKSHEFKKGQETNQFYVIMTDHDQEQKLVAGLTVSAYQNADKTNIYGAREGRVYEFIDTLMNVINNTKLNERESYSVDFETFKETINEQIEWAQVLAVKSQNPNAKTVNLHVVDAKVIEV
jgi:hypothetical protein